MIAYESSHNPIKPRKIWKQLHVPILHSTHFKDIKYRQQKGLYPKRHRTLSYIQHIMYYVRCIITQQIKQYQYYFNTLLTIQLTFYPKATRLQQIHKIALSYPFLSCHNKYILSSKLHQKIVELSIRCIISKNLVYSCTSKHLKIIQLSGFSIKNLDSTSKVKYQ